MIGSRSFATWLAVLSLTAITGCSGMKPFDPPNNREVGPEKGLFTGSRGEFVIYQDGGGTEADQRSEIKDRDDMEKEPSNAP